MSAQCSNLNTTMNTERIVTMTERVIVPLGITLGIALAIVSAWKLTLIAFDAINALNTYLNTL
jgi:hypothetical protein